MVTQAQSTALQQYATGWTQGSADGILRACAPGFVFGDPAKGDIARSAFAGYFKGFADTVGRPDTGNFMDIDLVSTCEVQGKLVASCRWVTGASKSVVGTGLIVVGDQGVERENVAVAG